ncbi:hypothetical protein TNCT_418781 [Trichonephila clavata]|uniref:Uncharacterized protein n=1 Tax=Trichonephila clavata TaxID=2740835 RepID=A0A8X6LXI0_TRICU|nr:hypothetical protein TNCT_418781 [Trichonephila clavata]
MSRLQFGSLLNAAWSKATTVGNGIFGFSATEIYTYNLHAIPLHAFAISDVLSNDTAIASEWSMGLAYASSLVEVDYHHWLPLLTQNTGFPV